MNPGLDSVTAMVSQLWPTYRASVQPMWDTRLHRHDVETIRTVLWQHRADYPDDTKPVWRTIYTMLSGGNTSAGTGKSDLQILLDQIRREIATNPDWHKCPAARTWSDSEAFENHIEANVLPILRYLDGIAKPDVDGRLAKLAAHERTAIVNPIIRDLKERGDPVPAWLVR